MFTGIVAEQGTVVETGRAPSDGVASLSFDAPATSIGLTPGGSIAVNGVCLSATTIQGSVITVDVMGETMKRTTIGALEPGEAINLERCVPAGGRLDGHVVQGHVDGVGTVDEREHLGQWHRVRIAVDGGLARYIAEKGSVAVDGVSLTVTAVSGADEKKPWFEVGLIPITLTDTVLGTRMVGSDVNIEVDVLAKYTERLLAFTTIEGGLR
ncbi:riboflavin synthase [Arthrobacter roseus]|uniref:riboflavin synthase n=1 Tax=Arthrobacter roseus TaxID=136274 RepID=UPI001966AD52|nr:riboflavin synthase [Arthrobacter roseus]MBM7848417.1 riboflavin synthase [Arthrobacter roseus]